MKKTSKDGGKSTAAAASKAALDAVIERAEYLQSIEGCVKANGLPGSELCKSFALARSLGDLDFDRAEDVERFTRATEDAYHQWQKLSTVEKKSILRGWNPTEPSTVAEELRALAGYDDTASAWVLSVRMHESSVDFFASSEIVSDICPVRLVIRQGAEKAETLAQLRSMLAALESRWDEAIALDGKQGLTVKGDAPLAIGTRVIDTGSDRGGGIIVGGFKGKNGWAYCYLNHLGEVDFQYRGGLKVAPAEVLDVHGADPLSGHLARS